MSNTFNTNCKEKNDAGNFVHQFYLDHKRPRPQGMNQQMRLEYYLRLQRFIENELEMDVAVDKIFAMIPLIIDRVDKLYKPLSPAARGARTSARLCNYADDLDLYTKAEEGKQDEPEEVPAKKKLSRRVVETVDDDSDDPKPMRRLKKPIKVVKQATHAAEEVLVTKVKKLSLAAPLKAERVAQSDPEPITKEDKRAAPGWGSDDDAGDESNENESENETKHAVATSINKTDPKNCTVEQVRVLIGMKFPFDVLVGMGVPPDVIFQAATGPAPMRGVRVNR